MFCLKLWFLGVGGWVSNPSFGQSGIVVDYGDYRILLDAGEGTYASLRMCTPFNVNDLDLIILTHRHGDHILGIPTMIQYAKEGGFKINIVTHNDVIQAIKELLSATGIPKYLNFINFHVISENSTINIDDVQIRAIKAIHPLPSLSYLIIRSKTCIVYTGDTAPNPELIRHARNCDIFIHEVSANEGLENLANQYGHTTSKQVIDLVNHIKPRYFVPIHYSEEPPYIPIDSLGTRIALPHKCSCLTIE